MSEVNFRKILIKYLKNSHSSCKELPRRIRSEDIGTLIFKIKNIDLDKGEIVHDFVQSLITLHTDVNKETDIAVTNKKCQKIMNAYKEEHDAVDGIMDGIYRFSITSLIKIILSSLCEGNTHLIKFLKMFVFLLLDLSLVSLSNDVYSLRLIVSLLYQG